MISVVKDPSYVKGSLCKDQNNRISTSFGKGEQASLYLGGIWVDLFSTGAETKRIVENKVINRLDQLSMVSMSS